MAKKTFPIRGINRSAPLQTGEDNPAAAQDGDCDELVNLRFKDGAWRPVGSKEHYATFPLSSNTNVSKMGVHKVSDGDEVFVAAVPGYGIYYWSKEVSVLKLIPLSNFSKAEDVEFDFLGSVMMVNHIVNNELLYFCYENQAYKKREPLPQIKLYTSGMGRVYVGDKSPHFVKGQTAEEKKTTQEAFGAKLGEVIEKRKEEGVITGVALIRAALELKDGSIANFSPLMAVSSVETPCIFQTAEVLANYFYFFVISGKICVNVALEGSKAEVERIHIYGSRIITMYNTEEPCAPALFDNVIPGTTTIVTIPRRVNVNPSLADFSFVRDEPLFLLRSITPDEVGSTIDITKELIKAETGTVMPSDDFTSHQLVGKSVSVINSRVILSGVTTKLFKGYSPFTSSQLLRVEVYDSENAETHVVDNGGAGAVANYNLILCYPDIRAKKMYTAKDTAFSPNFKNMWVLKPHPLMNLAYALVMDEKIANTAAAKTVTLTSGSLTRAEDVSKEEALSDMFFTYSIPGDNANGYSSSSYYQVDQRGICGKMQSPIGFVKMVWDNASVDVPGLKGGELVHPRKMRASNANIPYSFPSELTYALDGDVLGVAQNSIPLSVGQFGSFPLLIATTAGWRAAELAADGGFIASISPLNGLAPLSGRHIVNAGTNVVFVAREGVFLMRGAETVKISEKLEALNYTEILLGKDDLATRSELSAFKSGVFLNNNVEGFLTNVKMGYNVCEEELIFMNENYPFQYVHSLRNGQWSKQTTFSPSEINEKKLFDMAASYPKLYGFVKNYNLSAPLNIRIVDMTNESKAVSGGQSVGLATRGMRFDESAFKKVERLCLNGMVVSAVSVEYGGFTKIFVGLYMSNSGVAYNMVDYKVLKNMALNVRWLSSGCGGKFFKLVVLGRVMPGTNITTVDVETSEGLGN